MLTVRLIQTETELRKAFEIRRVVFIIGQNVAEEIEMDEYDEEATHILARLDDKPVGTARWRITENGSKLERFAVLDQARGQGVGSALVTFVLGRITPDLPAYLNAQVAVIPFYERFGFVAEGPVFYEADIPHRLMVLKKSVTPEKE